MSFSSTSDRDPTFSFSSLAGCIHTSSASLTVSHDARYANMQGNFPLAEKRAFFPIILPASPTVDADKGLLLECAVNVGVRSQKGFSCSQIRN